MLKYIRLREKHADQLLKWRMTTHVNKTMLTDMDEDQEKHEEWLSNTLNDKNCKFWVISFEAKNIGVVNITDIDYVNNESAVGFYIGEEKFIGLGGLFLPPVYDYVFHELKLRKIRGKVLDGNKLIMRIHEYHGWNHIGTIKKHIFKGGEYNDVHIIELLSTAWLSKREKNCRDVHDVMRRSCQLFE